MKFSIIIPVYNVAPYLRDCLDSVLAQTFTDWECVCVDDGSSDGSGEILDEYAAKDARCQVIHRKNCGVSSARNAGIAASMGEWMLFLDSDDVWHPDLIAICAKLIDEYKDAQIVRFGRVRFKDGERINWGDDAGVWRVSARDLSLGIVEGDVLLSFVCNCCHRSVIPRHGFKNYSYGEDLLFRAECLAVATQLVETAQCLYAYRMHSRSATHLPMSKRMLLDRIGYSHEWLQVLQKRPAPTEIWRRIAQGLTETYIQDLLSMKKSEREELWAAWYGMLPKLLRFNDVRGWYRLVASICSRVRSRGVALLLCAIPAELKRLKRMVFR